MFKRSHYGQSAAAFWFARVVSILPILLAMWFHAIALERWLLVVPAAIALIVAAYQSSADHPASRRWYAVIIGGVVMGLVFPAADVSSGPLPPALAATLTGVAIAIAVFAVYVDQLTIAWVSAWAMLTISGKSESAGPQEFALFAFLFCSMLATAMGSRILNHQFRRVLVFGTFVTVIAFSTAGIASMLRRVDRLFINTVESLVTDRSNHSTTGLGSSLTLGERSTIMPTMTPLLELSESPGLLRAKVMDQFDGRQWTTSLDLKHSLDGSDHRWKPSGRVRSFEMLFLEDLDKSIPSPAGTIRADHAEVRIEGGWIFRGKPDRISITLSADTAGNLPEEHSDPIGSGEKFVSDERLKIPDRLWEQIAPLAAAQVDPDSSHLQKAQAIESFFERNFEYSLTTDLSGEKHPLVTLIERRRPAYCVYFASAMAVMLRTQGVPTRIVTGFVPGEVNPLTGRVIIRSRDAHAWVEVWSPETNRYHAFDPTPSFSRREVMGHSDQMNPIRAAGDAVRSAIYRLWLLLRHQPLTGLQALILSPVLWVGLGACLLMAMKRRRRRIASQPTKMAWQSDPDLDRLYEQYLASLRSAGIIPGPAETDDELLARLATTGDQTRWESATRFIERYRESRFGGQVLDERLDDFGQQLGLGR